MPHKPRRPCRYPGCPNLCETGTYCEEHRREWSPESLRGNAAARGYDAKWREARKLFLQRNPLCQRCLKVLLAGIHFPVGFVNRRKVPVRDHHGPSELFKKADMVFTAPPYGVAIGDKNAILNSVQKAGRCCENIEGDTMSEAELYEMLKSAFINVRENCADDACYFVTSPQGGSLGLMMMMMKDAGLEVRHVLMWEKNSATFSLGRLDYDYQHEPIFYTWTKSHHNFRNGDFRTTVWKYDKPRKCDLHPTMKPVELVVNAIMDGTTENMIVLDAFGGSGTTLIASEQTNRKARLMELDPHYCDVIIQRFENLTGEKAVLLNA